VEWVVTSGRTIEEAIEHALDQLGVDEQDAEVEIVQDAQKGLFGRLRAEAQVRARVRPTSPRPKVDRRERRRGDRRGRDGGRTRKAGASSSGGTGGGQGSPSTVTREPVGARVPAGSRSDGRDRAAAAVRSDQESANDAPDGERSPGATRSSNRRRRRSRASRTAEGATVSESTQTDEVVGELDLDGQRAAVETFLTDLVGAFGRSDATVSVTVNDEDRAIEAAVEGPELGLLVGQKGVTLQAVQELVRSMVQRQFVGQSHARVRVDVAGYRARRKAALERFAIGVAENVKESGVAKALDPMGSADRKVVHDVVNDIDGVVTVSEGEDTARRVVIRPE
jgi:spoIIIJ-associated protein